MIIPIEEIDGGVFKLMSVPHLDEDTEKIDDMLTDTENFVLSFRASDNSFHEVNSEISDVLKKNMNLIKKGISLSSIASEITNSKELKIRRYVIWKNNEEAFLIGETLKALRKISKSTN